MKKILFAATALLAAITFAPKADAQVRIGVNLNIGDQPAWRDPGYDYVEYYYLPDIECYYDVPRRQFIYMDNNNWIYSPSLPPWYSSYNLYSGYKVVVNRPNAYRYFNDDRVRYIRRQNVPRYDYRHDNNYYRRDNNYYRDNNPNNRQWNDRRYDNNNHQWNNRRDDNNRNDGRWDNNNRRDNDNNRRDDNNRHDNGRHEGNRRG